jgi:hypothetical protein
MREVQRENREDLAVTVFELAAAFSNAADTNGNMACTIPTHRNTYKVTVITESFSNPTLPNTYSKKYG